MDKIVVPVYKSDQLDYVRIIELPDSMQLEILQWAVSNVIEPVKEKQGAVSLNNFCSFLREVSEKNSTSID